MSKEAMKLALEALEPDWELAEWYVDELREKAITALREALAEQKSGIKQVIELYDSPDQPPQQEPVAFEEWLAKQHGDPEEIGFLQALRIAYIAGQDSITAPPQRTWVGLTDEEILEAWCIHLDEGDEDEIEEWRHVINEAREIEAKLKEKNNA